MIRVIVISVLLLVILGSVACGDDREPVIESRNKYATRVLAPPNKVHVEYLVGGSAKRAGLTLSNASGNTEQKTVNIFSGATWSQTYDMEYGEFMYISAQNQNDYGTITCQIKVNGRVVEEAKSSGGYAIASCSGTAE